MDDRGAILRGRKTLWIELLLLSVHSCCFFEVEALQSANQESEIAPGLTKLSANRAEIVLSFSAAEWREDFSAEEYAGALKDASTRSDEALSVHRPSVKSVAATLRIENVSCITTVRLMKIAYRRHQAAS